MTDDPAPPDRSATQRAKVIARDLVAPLNRLRHEHDLALLLVASVLGLGAWLFAELAGAVGDGDAHAFDERLLMFFRVAGDPSDPIGGVAIEEAVRDLTALGGVLLTTLVTVIAVAYFVIDRRPRAGLFVAGAVISGVGVVFLLKGGFDRPRPDLVAHQMEALSASFPSGHAATSALVYLTIAALVARGLWRRAHKVFVLSLAIFVVVGVGLSRVYLGVHWPTDVLAGWVVGAAWATACWLLERSLRRRGVIEARKA
jgi:undecaprenyl-diphosphatase